MASTINGFIASENHDTPWSDEERESYKNIVKKHKALIIGKTTYDIMKVHGFDVLDNPTIVVMSHQSLDLPDNIICAKTPTEAIQIFEEKGFENVVLA